ncbi:hypothetical protein ACS0TY_013631 [Phlomoides rotata]
MSINELLLARKHMDEKEGKCANKMLSKKLTQFMKLVDPSFRTNEEGNEESGGSSKRSITSEDESFSIPNNPKTPGSGGSTISCPLSSTEVVEELRLLRLARENEVVVAREKLEMETQRLGMETLKMKHALLM